jgi:hypothetical protein
MKGGGNPPFVFLLFFSFIANDNDKRKSSARHTCGPSFGFNFFSHIDNED